MTAVSCWPDRSLAATVVSQLAAQPLVIIPLTLAGDPATTIAVMAGTSRTSPCLLTVTQPRKGELRLEFLAGLAGIVLGYITARQQATEIIPAARNREERHRYTDAPSSSCPTGQPATTSAWWAGQPGFSRPTGPTLSPRPYPPWASG
ncbi:MAG: hypothetical protein M3Y33_07520 [Actinomycetota bacterium]|nr:hypothetical protein [Actinomycetota bacterium]